MQEFECFGCQPCQPYGHGLDSVLVYIAMSLSTRRSPPSLSGMIALWIDGGKASPDSRGYSRRSAMGNSRQALQCVMSKEQLRLV